jgi:hypothetical protein
MGNSDLSLFPQKLGGFDRFHDWVRFSLLGRLENIETDVTAAEADIAAIETTLSTVTSGIYTPVLTNIANVAASTVYACQWLRVGNTVHGSGQVDIDPTAAATLTSWRIDLPVASNLANGFQCAGTINLYGGYALGNYGGSVIGDAANNAATFDVMPPDATNRSWLFQFTYRVI